MANLKRSAGYTESAGAAHEIDNFRGLTVRQIDVEIIHALALPDGRVFPSTGFPLVDDVDEQFGGRTEQVGGE